MGFKITYLCRHVFITGLQIIAFQGNVIVETCFFKLAGVIYAEVLAKIGVTLFALPSVTELFMAHLKTSWFLLLTPNLQYTVWKCWHNLNFQFPSFF